MTQAGYDAVGQVAGALSQHADTLLDRMSEGEQRIARRLLVRIVHLGDALLQGTRQRVPTERLRPIPKEEAARFDRVMAELVDARLLACAGQGSDQTVEVAHEALIRKWPRLTAWLQKDRELLTQLTKLEALLVQWRVHKALLSGEQLRFAEGVRRLYPEDFPAEAATLLHASQAAEQRARWFKRFVMAMGMIGTAIFAALYLASWRDNQRAELARKELITLLSQTSQKPSSVEMLRTLARLRLELELRPDRAMEALAQARQLAPGRFDEVSATAEQALLAETAPEACLQIALVAWSAARL